MDISPALDAVLELALTVILAVLIVGLVNELAGPEESEE